MKKFLLSIFALCAVLMTASATIIYVNPGHGSWSGNSRPMETIPYPALAGQGGLVDTLGFYESNTNLWKCLYMEEKLKEAGFEVKMSRRASGGAISDENGEYDKPLKTIATEAQYSGADYFISLHSNAGPTGAGGEKPANYPSYWYRGETNNDYSAGSIARAKKAWPYTFDIHQQKMEYNSHWSLNSPGLYADVSFWNEYVTSYFDGVAYKGYYGVLRHGIPGYLMETYFHTYQPACHRALNPDWCCQDGLRNYRGIAAWYDIPAEKTGYIMGYVRDAKKEINQAHYTYRQGNDIYFPINGAKVQLKDANGDVLQTNCYRYVARQLTSQDYYITDNNYNGVFVYENLKPGTYTITVEKEGYQKHTETITVVADKTAYTQVFLNTEIVWELNGGTVTGELPLSVSETYTLPIPTKDYHDFVGWFDNPEGTGTALTTIPAGWQGTLYAIWKEIEAEVKWELNGGKFPDPAKVPTNEELFTKFKSDYNTYYGASVKESSYSVGGGNVSNFFWNGKSSYGVDITVMMTDKDNEWQWLAQYIIEVSAKEGLIVSSEVQWRYGLTAFFLCSPAASYNADFFTAGKPESWGKAYQKVYGEETILPRYIAEEYTIPTPIKAGAEFIGWYDTNDKSGNKLTVLPVGYKGTVYAIWSDSPVAEADVTWVLNGGKVVETVTVPGTDVKVPTQEELWTSFKTAAGLTTLGTLAEITEAGAGKPHNDGNNQCACRIICGKLDGTMVSTVLGNAEWTWLRDYIITVQTTLTIEDLTTAAWRYAVAAFFLQTEHNSWPASANFATAGKPEAWGPAYQKANGGNTSSTTEWREVTLPSAIVGEPYTIPTPVKDGDAFVGWFDNANATGVALTVLPVGYQGTVYAIWKSTPTSVEQIVNPVLDIHAPMYDIMGRQVDENYRGIIIQNGHKYLLR